MVGDEREIVAAEPGVREVQIAGCAGERLDRVEALVDRASLAPQREHREQAPAPYAVDPRGQPCAAGGVDLHAEQVAAGLGDDLRQADGARGVARDRVLATGALEEHEPLGRSGSTLRARAAASACGRQWATRSAGDGAARRAV